MFLCRTFQVTASAIPAKYIEGKYDIHPFYNDICLTKYAGNFCCGGRAYLPNPKLRIVGVGRVSLPLRSDVVKAIKNISSQAPYGRGSETIIDKSIRNSLQIEPDKVAITNPSWKVALRELVAAVAKQLGTSADHVDAELYKLLFYEVGGHFKPHTDTEKVPGMFATLIVQLPSYFSGGDFVVRHHGVQHSFVADVGSFYKYHYVAHYADCTHEILPITKGSRLAAVYSLRWLGDGAPPAPPPGDDVPPAAPSSNDAQRLAARLAGLEGCLGYILEHRYTAVSLARFGVRALKGRDRAVADGLLAAGALIQPAAQAAAGRDGGLVIHLARAERRVNDLSEGCDFGPGPRLTCAADDVFRSDGSATDGAALGLLGRFRFYDDVVNRKVWGNTETAQRLRYSVDIGRDDAAEDIMPYYTPNAVWWGDAEGEPIEYWGNEGADGDKTYHCYVLTAWLAGGAFERGEAGTGRADKLSGWASLKEILQDSSEASACHDGLLQRVDLKGTMGRAFPVGLAL